MIISFNTDFPGTSGSALKATLKAHYALDLAIFLDGERVNSVVWFDIVEGKIARAVKDKNGYPQAHDGKLMTEILRGKVTLELVDTGEVPAYP